MFCNEFVTITNSSIFLILIVILHINLVPGVLIYKPEPKEEADFSDLRLLDFNVAKRLTEGGPDSSSAHLVFSRFMLFFCSEALCLQGSWVVGLSQLMCV